MPAPPCVTAVTVAPLAQAYVGETVPESLEERSRRPDSNRGPLHYEPCASVRKRADLALARGVCAVRRGSCADL